MALPVMAQSATGGTDGAWGAAGLALLIGMIPFALVTTAGFARYMATKTPAGEAVKTLLIGGGVGLAASFPIALLGAFFFNFSFVLGMISLLVMFGAVFFFAGKFLSKLPRTWSAATLAAGGATGALMLTTIIASAFGLAIIAPVDGSVADGYLMFVAAIASWMILFPPCLLGAALGIIYFRKRNGPGPGQPGQPGPPPPGPPEPPFAQSQHPQPPQWGPPS